MVYCVVGGCSSMLMRVYANSNRTHRPTNNGSHAGIRTDANEQSDGNVRALALVAYAKLECEWVVLVPG